MLLPVRLSVCLSETLVPVESFRNVSVPFGSLAIIESHRKFYRDRPRETPPSVGLNASGVAKYSDFGSLKGYISETLQNER